MNRPILFTLGAFALVAVLVLILFQQNKILQRYNPEMDYPCFNHSTTDQAQKIMDAWRGETSLIAAVKKIVFADYILILVYSSYLCWALYYRKSIEKLPPPRNKMVTLLWVGTCCILLGALLDAIQDSVIFSYVSSAHGRVSSLLLLTWFKWRLLALGVLILLISLIPRRFVTRETARVVLGYLSGLLKSIWLFFPSILFLFLTIFCFWVRGQGKDIMVAFTEEGNGGFRVVFFLVIGFWAYITWYSSRVIAYIKYQYRPLTGDFLYNYPRLAGNACFLVIELAILQAPVFEQPLSLRAAAIVFFLALIGLHFADKWISQFLQGFGKRLATHFWIVFVAFLAVLLITTLLGTGYIYCLLGLLILLHIIYLFYINLHRVMVGWTTTLIKLQDAPGISGKIIAFFCIPLEERGFLRWLIRVSIVAISIYVAAINCLGFARGIGPFSIVILAFTMLLAFGNVVTALSVRLGLNIHFLLFLLALLVGQVETHDVRQVSMGHTENGYKYRPSLKQYLTTWLQRLPKDSTKQDSTKYDMYFILANGGASRSGYWTAAVLGKLEDASRCSSAKDTFSRHVFCLSGTSGGGVGVATFFSLLNDHPSPDTSRHFLQSATSFLRKDYFTYTLARMLGPDFFNYIFQVSSNKDRGAALEESIEDYADTLSDYKPYFNRPFSQFPAMNTDSSKVLLPILFVNTTRMQDGNPGVVTNLQLDTTYFNQRIDVLHLLDSDKDISMASGAILGARFPYLSPAGRIGNSYFVDGGYFDNSGAGVVQELIRGILNIAREDTCAGCDRKIYEAIRRLHFKVLHIVNSPVDGSDTLSWVAPIKNDLLSPVSTIVGAYDMQTTVNDDRLRHFIADINKYFGIQAEYRLISLYKDSTEWKKDKAYKPKTKEDPYSMNWFMSDTTRNRIDHRLDSQPEVNRMLQQPNFSPCKK